MPNIDEFNKVVGLVFARLYRAFPSPIDIDSRTVARVLGVPDEPRYIMPSGRSLNDLLVHTLVWLELEGYTKSGGGVPGVLVVLTAKGLQAMNVVPPALTQTVGAELQKAAESSSGAYDWSRIGDLVGGIFGGFTKSIGSG